MSDAQQLDVEGVININGTTVDTRMTVYIGDSGISVVAKKHGSWLNIYTFNRVTMLNAGNFALLSQPIEYVIEGTCLGLFNQNFGDAREPEFFNRILKRIRITITYSRESVGYHLVGFAIIPDSSATHPRSYPAGDWEFDVRFEVAKAEIPALYGRIETASQGYMRAMGAL